MTNITPKKFKFNLDKAALLPPLILLVIGAAFLYNGLNGVRKYAIDASWPRTEGTVTHSAYAGSDGRRGSVYTWYIDYTVNGKQYSMTHTLGIPAKDTGEAIKVAYNPTNPAQAKVDNGFIFHAVLWIFPALGLIMWLAMPISYLSFRNRKPDPAAARSGSRQ